MNTYTKFIIKNYLISLLNVFFVFFSLIFILNLLTESEVDSYAEELERIRIQRQENDTNGEWGEYDPYMYPHKESKKLTGLMKHPKVVEACELLMSGKVFGVQTWAYFKPPGQLGRDCL